jgi:hypothetical protein
VYLTHGIAITGTLNDAQGIVTLEPESDDLVTHGPLLDYNHGADSFT